MGTRINTAVAGRAALAVLLAVVLAGCAAQSAREAEAPAQARPPASLPAESAARPAAGAPAQDIATIVAMLEDGRMSEGREALRVLLAREPGNALARSLVRQLDSDPVALLGAEHQPYTVRAGDTLGGLAARHLGDSSLFVALARYNNISRPRLLAVIGGFDTGLTVGLLWAVPAVGAGLALLAALAPIGAVARASTSRRGARRR